MFHCILHLSVAGRTSDYVIIKAPLSFLSGKSSSGWKGRTGRVPSGAQQEPQGACSQILEHLWSKTKLSSILLLGEGVVIFSRNLELFKQICELSLAFLTFSFHSFFFSQSILLFEPARSLSPSCSCSFLQNLVCTSICVSFQLECKYLEDKHPLCTFLYPPLFQGAYEVLSKYLWHKRVFVELDHGRPIRLQERV